MQSRTTEPDTQPLVSRLADLLARGTILTLVLTFTIWAETQVLQRLGGSAFVAMTGLVHATGQAAQDRTTVILYDDSFDKELGQAWPLPYSTWSRVAVRAWCEGASVLMFDLGFTRNAQDPGHEASASEGKFVSLLETLSADPGDKAAADQRAGLFSTCMHSGSRRTGRRSASSMPVYIATPSDPALPASVQTLAVDVVRSADGMYAAHGESGRVKAAFAVARAYCMAGAAAAPGCNGAMEDVVRFEPQDDWTTPEAQSAFSPSGGDGKLPGCTGRDYRHGVPMLWWFVRNGPIRNWGTCPPVLTLQASQLWDGETIGDLLLGKAVFIGGRINGLQDSVQTPLHLDLPGVYVHALATEQLLSGSITPPPPPSDMQYAILAMIILLAILTQRLMIKQVGGRWPARIVGVLACAATAMTGTALNWPLATLVRDSLLVLIALGFPSLDPAEMLLYITNRLRDIALGDFMPIEPRRKSQRAAERGGK